MTKLLANFRKFERFQILISWCLCQFLSFTFQEFGDSARARKLWAEQDSDDDEDETIEHNPKLEQGKKLSRISNFISNLSSKHFYVISSSIIVVVNIEKITNEDSSK